MNEIASRYGLALFSLASEQNKVAELQKEMKDLNRIFNENVDFVTLLGSSFIPLEKRLSLIDHDLSGLDDDILCFLKVIITNNRTRYLLEILQGFNTYCNEYRGVTEGLIYSTVPLDEANKLAIESKISQREGKKVELISRLDPTLIGGIKVVIDGHIYDDSIKNRLAQLKSNLLKKEGSHDEN